MNREKIYIIQLHTGTIPAKFVKLVTRYEYSHVGICLTSSCDEVYSFGRRSLRNFLNGGFIKEHKDGLFFTKFHKTVCRIYEVEIEKEQYIEIKELLKQMEENADVYRYDFFGAFLRYFKIPVSFENKYVCSSFVANILEQSGVCSFPKKPKFAKPVDFENIEGAKEVYMGEYKSLSVV